MDLLELAQRMRESVSVDNVKCPKCRSRTFLVDRVEVADWRVRYTYDCVSRECYGRVQQTFVEKEVKL